MLYSAGVTCSGGYSPCLKRPVAMAYLEKKYCKLGTEVSVQAGKGSVSVVVSKMPFVPTNYKAKE